MNEIVENFIRNYAAFAIAAMAWCWSPGVAAYETDQFTSRNELIADSTDVLNREVNNALAAIVSQWRQGHDELAIVDSIYREIGGLHWVDKLERWAINSDEVEKLDIPRYDSVFAGLPIWASRVTYFFGVGKTIRLNDQLIGSDKIGHFLSQGRKFYKRYLRYGSEERAAEQSAFTERAVFGRLTTGSYSNADLVANYEGYRFYRSLFDDSIIPGKRAILSWEDGGWVIQRDFDWADHVNEYWDEALNVNHFDALLYKHMHGRLIGYCPQYWAEPDRYAIVEEEPLIERYAHLQLYNTSELRLDSLCPVQVFLESGESGFAKAGISSPDAQASP